MSSEKGFSGWASLSVIAGFHQISAHPVALAQTLGVDISFVGVTEIQQAAKELGLTAKFRKIKPARLASVSLPLMLQLNDGCSAVVLRNLPDSQFLVLFPPEREPKPLTLEEVCALWSGEVLLIKRAFSLQESARRFDIAPFFPSHGNSVRPLRKFCWPLLSSSCSPLRRRHFPR